MRKPFAPYQAGDMKISQTGSVRLFKATKSEHLPHSSVIDADVKAMRKAEAEDAKHYEEAKKNPLLKQYTL